MTLCDECAVLSARAQEVLQLKASATSKTLAPESEGSARKADKGGSPGGAQMLLGRGRRGAAGRALLPRGDGSRGAGGRDACDSREHTAREFGVEARVRGAKSQKYRRGLGRF